MVTLAEIAKKAGVSTIVVSRILNGGKVYRQKKAVARAEKIRNLAAEMGYRPNLAAQSIRSGKTGNIGLLMSVQSSRSLLPSALLEGILSLTSKADLNLVLGHVSDNQLHGKDPLPKMLSTQTCDGLLVNYNADIPVELEELINNAAIPAVWMNSRHEHNCVYPDDRKAAWTLVRRLVKSGHSRIAYADYQISNTKIASHYSNAERFAGYAAAMIKAGLEPRRVDTAEELEHDGQLRHTAAWLTARDAPTAVVCYSHFTANVIVYAASRFLRKDVQKPLVFAFDSFGKRDLPLEWTQVTIPMQRMGEEAVHLLVSLLKNPETKNAPIALPFEQPEIPV